MSVDPFTGRNPSYAFVDFETPEDANRAMSSLNGMEVLGREVKINPGVRRQAGESGPQSRVKSYDGRRGVREERGEGMSISSLIVQESSRPCGQRSANQNPLVPSNYKPTFDRWSRIDAPSHFNAPEQGLRLYVGNLPRIEPQAAADASMQELFASEGFELTAVSKMISPKNTEPGEEGNRYFCFVDLASADEADRAIEALNGREVEGWGTIRVNKARDNRERKQVREQSGYQRPSRNVEEGGVWRS